MIRNVPSRSRQGRSQQGGAILVTSLLLLLILTVLGVAMMRMTNMQERMASNTRDVNLALQAAEAALRQAEDTVARWSTEPVPTYNSGCVLCERGVLPLAIYDTTQFDWSTAQAFQAPSGYTFDSLAVPVPPRYTIEKVVTVIDNAADPGRNSSGVDRREVYRMTSRSTGASGLTNTVLQSTFTRRY